MSLLGFSWLVLGHDDDDDDDVGLDRASGGGTEYVYLGNRIDISRCFIEFKILSAGLKTVLSSWKNVTICLCGFLESPGRNPSKHTHSVQVAHNLKMFLFSRT